RRRLDGARPAGGGARVLSPRPPPRPRRSRALRRPRSRGARRRRPQRGGEVAAQGVGARRAQGAREGQRAGEAPRGPPRRAEGGFVTAGVWRIWIDTGGTFTDCLAVDPRGALRRAKVLSTSAVRGRIAAGSGGSTLRVAAP